MRSAKYYTQFTLEDEESQAQGNEMCGVVELNMSIDSDCDKAEIEAILARNFDLDESQVKLISWSRLH